MYEEVKQKRTEEVDLETGRRRSHVEEVRYEVLDLTGETPGRRGSQRTPLQPLPSQISEGSTNTLNISKALTPTPVKSPQPAQDPDQSIICLSHTWGILSQPSAAKEARSLAPATPRSCPKARATGKLPLLR